MQETPISTNETYAYKSHETTEISPIHHRADVASRLSSRQTAPLEVLRQQSSAGPGERGPHGATKRGWGSGGGPSDRRGPGGIQRSQAERPPAHDTPQAQRDW